MGAELISKLHDLLPRVSSIIGNVKPISIHTCLDHTEVQLNMRDFRATFQGKHVREEYRNDYRHYHYVEQEVCFTACEAVESQSDLVICEAP